MDLIDEIHTIPERARIVRKGRQESCAVSFAKRGDNTLFAIAYPDIPQAKIMPADKVRYYNKIDMGIFLFMLETCLDHEKYTYERTLFADTTDDSIQKTLIARYAYSNR